MEKIQKTTIFSILIGITVTLVSGAFPNILGWVGGRYWGYLLPWLVEALTWPPSPKKIIWQNLIIDLVVWSVIPFAVLTVFFRGKTK